MLTPKEFKQIKAAIAMSAGNCPNHDLYIECESTIALLRTFVEPDEPEAPPDGAETDDGSS